MQGSVSFKDATSIEESAPLPTDNTYEGTGNKATTSTPFHSNGGITTFTMTHTGSSTFTVYLWNKDKIDDKKLIENAIGPVTDDSKVLNLEVGNYFFDVTANGDWFIKIDGSISEVPEKDAVLLATIDTDDKGIATYTYPYNKIEGGFTSTVKIAGIAKIRAEAGQLTEDIDITQLSGPAYYLELSANPNEIKANETQSTIMAKVRDQNNNLTGDGEVVKFAIKAVYEITDNTVTNLKTQGVPESITSKLEGLKGNKYTSEEALVNALNTAISNTQIEQYKTLILQYAKTDNGKFSNGLQTIEVTTQTGLATAALISPISSTNSSATVEATITRVNTNGTTSEVTQEVTVQYIGISLSDMSANPSAIFADGKALSVIKVRLKDANGIALKG